MVEELRPPTEGFSTVSANFTREYVEKLLATLKRLRLGGMHEADILAKMKNELRDMDARSRQRLHEMSLDRPVPDDFTKDDVAEEKEEKPGTWAVTLKAPPTAIVVGSLVQHRGSCCVVVRVQNSKLTLKSIR